MGGPVVNVPKRTYRACTVVALVAAAGTAPFLRIEGSASKTVIVRRITLSGLTLTAVEYLNLIASKRSSAGSGGTPTELVETALDSNADAPTAVAKGFTAAPTAGDLVGVVGARRVLGQATVAAAGGQPLPVVDFVFGDDASEAEGCTLRGVAQGLDVAFAAAPASAVSLLAEIEWLEV